MCEQNYISVNTIIRNYYLYKLLKESMITLLLSKAKYVFKKKYVKWFRSFTKFAGEEYAFVKG